MKKTTLVLLGCLFALAGCQKQDTVAPPQDELLQKLVPMDILLPRSHFSSIEEWGATLNQSLAAQGIQLEKAEFIRRGDAGQVILFKQVGNKQLSSDFVPYDPRNGTGADVPYIVDITELGTTQGAGMSELATYNAITSAMNTWESVTCSQGLNIPNLGSLPLDLGYVHFLLGAGGIGGYFPGTILHGGILPSSFFETLGEGGGSGIIGSTFTFTYIEDINQDGKSDVAIKEIYYNDYFEYRDAPEARVFDPFIDFETIVLHEVGHGLSQDHFGKLSINYASGKLIFSPFALMNAGYTQARRKIVATDKAGHCSLWDNWPFE